MQVLSASELPEGAVPIFLSSKTQEIFECRTDEEVTEENRFKFIMKEDIMADFFNRAAICDFHPVKEAITVRLHTCFHRMFTYVATYR